jgi:hypothetical protein
MESASRGFLTGNRGYRFCNFAEVWVSIDVERKTVVGQGFTPSSGMYRAPSYKGIPSHAFASQQEIFLESDAVRFTQVVGARTVSPEMFGTGAGIAGGALTGGIVGCREAADREWVEFRKKYLNDKVPTDFTSSQ